MAEDTSNMHFVHGSIMHFVHFVPTTCRAPPTCFVAVFLCLRFCSGQRVQWGRPCERSCQWKAGHSPPQRFWPHYRFWWFSGASRIRYGSHKFCRWAKAWRKSFLPLPGCSKDIFLHPDGQSSHSTNWRSFVRDANLPILFFLLYIYNIIYSIYLLFFWMNHHVVTWRMDDQSCQNGSPKPEDSTDSPSKSDASDARLTRPSGWHLPFSTANSSPHGDSRCRRIRRSPWPTSSPSPRPGRRFHRTAR